MERAQHGRTASIAALEAENQIRAVLARYCRGMDRLDRATVLSCYHPDAIDDHGPLRGTAEEFVDWSFAVLRRYERSFHSLHTTVVELDGARARSESYVTGHHIGHDERGGSRDEVMYARYIDDFARRDGSWLIANRLVVWEWTRLLTGELACEDVAALPVGRRDGSDPVLAWAGP